MLSVFLFQKRITYQERCLDTRDRRQQRCPPRRAYAQTQAGHHISAPSEIRRISASSERRRRWSHERSLCYGVTVVHRRFSFAVSVRISSKCHYGSIPSGCENSYIIISPVGIICGKPRMSSGKIHLPPMNLKKKKKALPSPACAARLLRCAWIF